MPNFEVFRETRETVADTQPQVTVQAGGVLTLNKAAHEVLGSPEAVELLFDPEERVIGLRGADPSEPHARALRKATPRASSQQVSIHLFAKHYGIDLSKSRRYPAKMHGRVLAIDLNGESFEVARGRRGPQSIRLCGPAGAGEPPPVQPERRPGRARGAVR